MRIYTAHLRRYGADPERDFVLVKEGFCWPAFFFAGVWALWHRLWLAALVLIAVPTALNALALAVGLDATSRAAVSIGIAVLIGFIANDLRRRQLDRRGLSYKGVVVARGREAAERRFLDAEPELAEALDPGP